MSKRPEDKVSELLGFKPNIIVKGDKTFCEWNLENATLSRVPSMLQDELKGLGCSVCGVDSSRFPYYWVSVRLCVSTEK